MTDNDAIKAYECCEKENGTSPNCDECPASGSADSNCFSTVRKRVLEIVKRQKAEIERLQKENEILSTNADNAFQEGFNENRELFKQEVATELHDEAVEDFAHFLIDKAENGAIQVCDLPDLVFEWKGAADNAVEKV